MKNLFIISLFWMISLTSSAQMLNSEVISSSGSYHANATGSLNWTLGETTIETIPVGSIILTQGFQQPGYQCLGISGTLVVENQTIEAGGTFCFNATYAVVVENLTVEAGGSAHFIAGHKIVFLPDVVIHAGATMLAQITATGDYCTNDKSLVAAAIPEAISEQPAIKDFESSDMMMVYPNPSKGHLKVELIAPDINRGRIEIQSMTGSLLLQHELTGQSLYEFNLVGYPRGIYFIRVLCGDKMGVKKVILQ